MKMTYGKVYLGHTEDNKLARYTGIHLIHSAQMHDEENDETHKLEAHYTKKGNIVFRRVDYLNTGDDEGKKVVFHPFKDPQAALAALKADGRFGSDQAFIDALNEFINTEQF
jgi:hypothetical protein